tara:strand:+ start:621 stop:863 length:243 start_codon:yes stop_codon:yes gene_type:complete
MGEVSIASYIWTALGEGATRRWTRLEQRVHELKTVGVAEAADDHEARKSISRKIFGTIREMNKLEEKAGIPEHDRTPQVR